MLRRIGNWFGATRLPGGSGQWTPDWLASAGLPPSRDKVAPAELAAALRCASILSDSLASVSSPAVFLPVAGGGRERQDTASSRALQRTAFVDWETAFLQAALGGNGFLHIHRDDQDEPHILRAIPARLVSVAVDANGAVWYERLADAQLGISEAVLPAADVVHIRMRTLDNPLIGVSPLRAAGASISGVVETFQLRESLFRNLSVAGSVFSTDLEISAEQMDTLRKSVTSQTKRLAAGGSLILASGLKVDRGANGTTAHDQTLIEALEFSVAEIARIYGIPPSMLAQAGESSYSTAAEERRAYLTATLAPWASRVADELTTKLLTAEDRATVAYDFTADQLGHGQERAETLSKLVNAGIISANEGRNWLGLADTAGGDVLRAPANNYPLPAWLQFEPPKQEPAPDVKAIIDEAVEKTAIALAVDEPDPEVKND